MSKTKLFLDVVSDLRTLADSLHELANAFVGETPSEAQPSLPVVTPSITLEQVRAVLASKSQDGFTAEVRALLEKHGAPKLSEITPDCYAALLADAEALGHG